MIATKIFLNVTVFYFKSYLMIDIKKYYEGFVMKLVGDPKSP